MSDFITFLKNSNRMILGKMNDFKTYAKVIDSQFLIILCVQNFEIFNQLSFLSIPRASIGFHEICYSFIIML